MAVLAKNDILVTVEDDTTRRITNAPSCEHRSDQIFVVWI